jgi:hypothetical protein
MVFVTVFVKILVPYFATVFVFFFINWVQKKPKFTLLFSADFVLTKNILFVNRSVIIALGVLEIRCIICSNKFSKLRLPTRFILQTVDQEKKYFVQTFVSALIFALFILLNQTGMVQKKPQLCFICTLY